MLSVFGADDWVMLAAAFMALATLICFVGESNYGVGRHVECIAVPELEKMMKWQFFHNLWVMFGVVFVKISVALFLMRLAPKKSWKWFFRCCISTSQPSGEDCMYQADMQQSSWSASPSPALERSSFPASQ